MLFVIANSHDKDGDKVDIKNVKWKILMTFYDEIDNLGL